MSLVGYVYTLGVIDRLLFYFSAIGRLGFTLGVIISYVCTLGAIGRLCSVILGLSKQFLYYFDCRYIWRISGNQRCNIPSCEQRRMIRMRGRAG